MNYQITLSEGTNILKKNFVKNPILDSEILLASVLKIKREKLLLNLDKAINDKQLNNFYNLINRRKYKEPLAYIIGYKEFWKRNFIINKNVLIPRPDTEILVEEILKYIPFNSSKNILDIGTGSGCILLSVLNERKKCYGVGVDVSKEAINIAKTNAKIQQVSNRIKFFNSDIDKFLVGKYDFIISNPPYIKKFEINKLDEDIRSYEPKLALDGGCDGLAKIRLVIDKSSNLLKRNGRLLLEIDNDQTSLLKMLLVKKGFYINKIIKDLTKNNRCVLSTKIN
tara:strand:+ start:221 stop:1066 length:846 start_codon:yes stop_codon:yes gene_type:complete